jgi:hypothetical protein
VHAPPSRSPSLSADHRRALTLLAGSRDGCPEALMLAHGFTTKQIDELVGAGHALVDARNMRAGGRKVAVRRLRITAAGRLALRGMTQPPARRADALTLKPPSPCLLDDVVVGKQEIVGAIDAVCDAHGCQPHRIREPSRSRALQ